MVILAYYYIVLHYYIITYLYIYKINNKYICLYIYFYEELAYVEAVKFHDLLSAARDPGKLVI